MKEKRILLLLGTLMFCLGAVRIFLLGEQGLLPSRLAGFQGSVREQGGTLPGTESSYGKVLKGLNSPYAVLLDAETGEILAEKRGSGRIYPASLTKLMTALLTIERVPELDSRLTMPPDIYPGLYQQNASLAGFEEGEEVRVKDLLYGLLLPSGGECCLALADYISGSEEAFVELMNERAQQIGLRHTHFCNCTGLHDPQHYSTVEDIACLLQSCLGREEFREVFTSWRYSVPPTNLHPEGFTFYSTLYQEGGKDLLEQGTLLGGKTGYTGQAGLCLASLGNVQDREYILVTAGAEGDHKTEQYHIQDARKVYGRLKK